MSFIRLEILKNELKSSRLYFAKKSAFFLYFKL